MPLDSAESIHRWDAYAETFAGRFGEMGDPLREAVLTPAMLDTIGDVAGMHVLDAGCGEGYLSRLLAKRGARVVAFDAAPAMIAIARERTPADLAIEYRVADAERMDGFAAGAFDVVVSNFVLIDLADYRAAIRESFRVLVPGGRCVLSVCHPCFTTPVCGWVRDADGRKLHWKIDRYFDEGPYEERILLSDERLLIQYHRTLASYVRAIVDAGFVLDDLVEPTPTDEAVAADPHWLDDFRMTHVLIFDCRKPEAR